MSYLAPSQSRDDCWLVVHCRPGKEFFAESALQENLGLSTFLPVVLTQVRGIVRKVPFFPGYLFLAATPAQPQLASIRSMPGVLRVLEFGGGPQLVPGSLVRSVMERLDALNSHGGMPGHNFKLGETVWLKSGPFRGLQAVFMGPMTPSARVTILLEFLGRLNEVRVELDDLTRSQYDAQPGRRRGTRGKGRTIKST